MAGRGRRRDGCRDTGRRDTGAAALEYIAAVALAAGIVAGLLVVPGLAPGIDEQVRRAVCSILTVSLCGGGGTAGPAADGGGKPVGGNGSTDPASAAGDAACTAWWCGPWDVTKAIGGGVWNGVTGVGGAAWDTVTGTVDLVTHPGQLIDAGKAIIDDPLGVAEELVWDSESRQAAANGDYGTAIGRTIWNVGSLVIAPAKVGKLGKLAGLAKLAEWTKLVGRARDAAAAAKAAAKAGDLAKAHDFADTARRLADEAAAKARALGCPIAAPRVRPPGGSWRIGPGGAAPGGALMVVMPPTLLLSRLANPFLSADPCTDAADAARQAEQAAKDAEAAATTGRRVWPENPAPGTPEYDLGFDPAVNQFRIAEYQTATRIIDETGADLVRAKPGEAFDWVDRRTGVTYDAVGNFPGKFFDQQWPNLQAQIQTHLGKADRVPIDVSQFSPDQIARIEQFIAPYAPRVFVVGRP